MATKQQIQILGTKFVNKIKERIKADIYPQGRGYKGKRPGTGRTGNKVATGQLLNSITATAFEVAPGEYALEFTYMDYFKVVNLGRRPKKKRPPIPAIFDWIKVRGITGRDKNGNELPTLSLAFAIATNIKKFGIEPTYIYDKGYDDFEDLLENPPPEFQELYEELYEAIGNDVENLMENRIVTYFKNIPEITIE